MAASDLSVEMSKSYGVMVGNMTLVLILDEAFKTGGTYADVRKSANAAIANADKILALRLPRDSQLRMMIEDKIGYARRSFCDSLERYLSSIPDPSSF